MDINFVKTIQKDADTIILPVYEGTDEKRFDLITGSLDTATAKAIETIANKSKSFKAKHGSTLLMNLPEGAPADHAILLGLGQAGDMTPHKAQEAGGKLFAALKGTGAALINIIIEAGHAAGDNSPSAIAAHIAYGMELRSYKFDLYKSKKKDNEDETPVVRAAFVISTDNEAEKIFTPLQCVASGVYTARDFVN